MNRPSSAFGLLLGFLALTMFAVSSTSRSTTVKPAANYADRAAIRRQASLSRTSALAAAAENTPAGDSLDGAASCMPDLTGLLDDAPPSSLPTDDFAALATLRDAATTRLLPAAIESVRDTESALALSDGRADFDDLCEDVVLGGTIAAPQKALEASQEKARELSATEITAVFQSILGEKPAVSRSAKSKSQKRASLEGLRSLADDLVRIL